MSESLIEMLPKIVAEGKKEVEQIMERLERIDSDFKQMNMSFRQKRRVTYLM